MTVVPPGGYGKPRPALIIQSDFFVEHPSVTVLPTSDNGLEKPSQVMVDKIQTTPEEKIGRPIGHLKVATLVAVHRTLAVFLGFA